MRTARARRESFAPPGCTTMHALAQAKRTTIYRIWRAIALGKLQARVVNDTAYPLVASAATWSPNDFATPSVASA